MIDDKWPSSSDPMTLRKERHTGEVGLSGYRKRTNLFIISFID